MAKIDNIYNAADDYGLITSMESQELGVSDAELVQLAARGKLVRVARGVYRIPTWPYQEQLSYAIATKAAGKEAYLFGESVVSLLGLVPTDPRIIWVATPRRTRRSLGSNVCLLWRKQLDATTIYEGIPAQVITEAIIAAATTMGSIRAEQAAYEAERQGFITTDEHTAIKRMNHFRIFN